MSTRELVRRCLPAAAGGVLAALFVLVARGASCTGSGCLIVPLLQGPVVLAGAFLLSLAPLALARVRPALAIAVAGPLVALALATTVLDVAGWPLVAVIAAGYAFAAFVTADGLSRAWRVALVTPMVVLFGWGVLPLAIPSP